MLFKHGLLISTSTLFHESDHKHVVDPIPCGYVRNPSKNAQLCTQHAFKRVPVHAIEIRTVRFSADVSVTLFDKNSPAHLCNPSPYLPLDTKKDLFARSRFISAPPKIEHEHRSDRRDQDNNNKFTSQGNDCTFIKTPQKCMSIRNKPLWVGVNACPDADYFAPIKLVYARYMTDRGCMTGLVRISRPCDHNTVVFVRYTIDNWLTFCDVLAVGGSNQTLATFKISFDGMNDGEAEVAFALCIRNMSWESWDNNMNHNYRVRI